MGTLGLESVQRPLIEITPPHASLELLKRSGKVVLRQPIPLTGLMIGRAIDNDLVLDDPFVSPHHARLDWVDGRLRVTDLDSLNGSWIGRRRCHERLVPLKSGSLLRLGRTWLRYRCAGDPLPETWLDRNQLSPLRHLERPLIPILLFLLTLAYTLGDLYLDTVEPLTFQRMLPNCFYLLALVAGWASLWSFSNRIVAQRWNLLRHAGTACLFLLGMDLWEVLVEYGCFISGWDAPLTVLKYLGGLVLLTALFYLHLQLVSPKPRGRLLTTSFAIAGTLLMLLVGMNELRSGDFSADPEYRVTLKSPLFQLRQGKSLEDFFTTTDAVLKPLEAE